MFNNHTSNPRVKPPVSPQLSPLQELRLEPSVPAQALSPLDELRISEEAIAKRLSLEAEQRLYDNVYTQRLLPPTFFQPVPKPEPVTDHQPIAEQFAEFRLMVHMNLEERFLIKDLGLDLNFDAPLPSATSSGPIARPTR